MENGATSSGSQDVAETLATAKSSDEQEDDVTLGQSEALEVSNKRRENSFRAAHGVVTAFLTLLMYVSTRDSRSMFFS